MNSRAETYILLKSDREQGIKILFELYAQKLFRYATKNWKVAEDDAWDLIYKTIYKVADSVTNYEFKSEQAFASFIFKILINNMKDHLRRQKKMGENQTEIPLHDNMANAEPGNEVTGVPNRPLEILNQELEKLEDWQRILLLMRSQDIAYSEISKYVNKPENQLKTYYARLKKQLMERVTALVNKSEPKENV